MADLVATLSASRHPHAPCLSRARVRRYSSSRDPTGQGPCKSTSRWIPCIRMEKSTKNNKKVWLIEAPRNGRPMRHGSTPQVAPCKHPWCEETAQSSSNSLGNHTTMPRKDEVLERRLRPIYGEEGIPSSPRGRVQGGVIVAAHGPRMSRCH